MSPSATVVRPAAFVVALAATASSFAGKPATVSLLDGSTRARVLTAIDAEAVTLKTGDDTEVLRRDEVLSVVFEPVEPASSDRVQTVSLADGSEFPADVTEGGVDSLAVRIAGDATIRVDRAAVAGALFGTADRPVVDRWRELLAERRLRDTVVTRKGDTLDTLEGVLTTIDAESVRFIPDGLEDELPIRRTNPSLFAILPGGTVGPGEDPACEIRLSDGGRLRGVSVTTDGDRVRIDGFFGEATLPLEAVASIDLALGRVRDLGELHPVETNHTPFFDLPWEVQVDRNDDGGPLRIGGTTHRTGVWIHSRTAVTYRLDGRYRRFRAVVGIEDLVRPLGGVTFAIDLDGRERFRREVLGTDEPFTLDLPVTDAREMTISVGYGEDGLDIADHLALGTARLIK